MVQEAAQLQSRALVPQRVPAPGGNPAGGGGGDGAGAGVRFTPRPGFDLPSAVAASPQWEGWLRRLRDAVVAWQQAQQAEQQQMSDATGSTGGKGSTAGKGGSEAAGPAVLPSSPAPTTADAALAQGSAPGTLSASFAIRGVSPGGAPMQQTLTLRVAAPEGRQLVQAVSRAVCEGAGMPIVACELACGPLHWGPAVLQQQQQQQHCHHRHRRRIVCDGCPHLQLPVRLPARRRRLASHT